MEESPIEIEESPHALYKDCISLPNMDNISAYAPKNELNLELYFQLISSVSFVAPNESLTIDKATNEVCRIDDVLFESTIRGTDKKLRCSICKLKLPVDLKFYSNMLQEAINECNLYRPAPPEVINVCKECINDERLLDVPNEVIISSGMDNVNDWIWIVSFNKHVFKPWNGGTPTIYNYDCFCNLNPKSCYYKQFAMNKPVYMLGDWLEKCEPNVTLESILHSFNVGQ